MYTVDEKKVSALELPGRRCTVLVGSESLNAKNITFGICEVPPLGKMDPHAHAHAEEVIYIVRGRGYVVVDGTKEPLQPGTVIYLPIGC